ncbi:hypothetical protein MMC28_010892 [Mycoblastus sanguinarius]|nr:hypothetical protein [Mycoblastus sanguinarius]
MKLRHLHLNGITPYLRASAIQDHLVRIHLDHKAAQHTTQAPSPVLLTFQTYPTYTCGRREIGILSTSQIAHLKAGGKAEFHEALRGGQTTFHGPGQLTAYLIISLQVHKLTPRSQIRLLEDSVIGTCAWYGLKTHTTENPGVWIGSRPNDRKIASVGVHLRRHIASHGIGLNVSVDLGWFDKIVACGLVGKKATNIEKEWVTTYKDMDPARVDSFVNGVVKSTDFGARDEYGSLLKSVDIPIPMRQVADVFAKNVAEGLSGVDERVEEVDEEDIWPG